MQPQDDMYKEYSNADAWAVMWLLLIIMQRVHSGLSLALDTATSACDICKFSGDRVWVFQMAGESVQNMYSAGALLALQC
jgi:hypothetical protein